MATKKDETELKTSEQPKNVVMEFLQDYLHGFKKGDTITTTADHARFLSRRKFGAEKSRLAKYQDENLEKAEQDAMAKEKKAAKEAQAEK